MYLFGGSVKPPLWHYKHQRSPVRTHYPSSRREMCSRFHLHVTYPRRREASALHLLSQYHVLNNPEGAPHGPPVPPVLLCPFTAGPGLRGLSVPRVYTAAALPTLGPALTLLPSSARGPPLPPSPSLACITPTGGPERHRRPPSLGQ